MTKKILILNAPCNGFGDIVYAMKLSNYLKQWYDSSVFVATTQPNNFVQLGFDKEKLFLLKSKYNIENCRKFANMKMYDLNNKIIKNGIFDYIFVAPLSQDNEVSLSDVRALIPYATKQNTKFWSEYNDELSKKIDFQTGVGKNRLGLFLFDTNISEPIIKNPYIFIYISDIYGSKSCLLSFLKMVIKKYYTYETLIIIAPPWIEKFRLDIFKAFIDDVNMVFKGKENIDNYVGESKNTIIFDLSILPVSNNEVLNLMKYSLSDILITGDQSLSDVLSCCPEKNIFYQSAGWKTNLALELAKLMPNKWLKKKRTSCGSLEAINYKSDYRKFVKEWDFRVRGKPILDKLFN